MSFISRGPSELPSPTIGREQTDKTNLKQIINIAPGKADSRYWQKRVRKTGSRGGQNAFYSVQFQHAGRRMELSLGTASQTRADGVSVERRTDTKFYGCGVDPRTLLRSAP